MVLGRGLSPAVRRGRGGALFTDVDGGGERGHLAVRLGQGLMDGFCCLAERDSGADDIELVSVPDDFVDTQSLWFA